jgi:hypothetical protein
MRYLTGNKITDILHSVARAAHPDMPEDKIKHFSSHLGRVWALVLLDKASMTLDFMKLRLCWMGDSYRLYLRNTSILQRKHINALHKDFDEMQCLLGRNCGILPDIVPTDDEMGEYKILFLLLLFFFIFSFFHFFFFVYLCHIMVLSNDKTSCTFLRPSCCNLCLQEACMPMWRFGLPQNFWEPKRFHIA